MSLVSKKTFVKKILPWLMCILAAVFYCFEYFQRVSTSVLQTEIMSLYHINIATFGLLASAYYWAYTPMQVLVGTLMDHFGVRRLMTLAILSCTIGAFFFGMHENIALAMLSRFMIGFGSAFAFVGVLKLAADWLPYKFFSFFSGITTMLGMLGAISGELMLESLVEDFGLSPTLMGSAIFAAALAGISWFCIKDHPRSSYKMKLKKGRLTFWLECQRLFEDIRSVFTQKQFLTNALLGAFLFMPTTLFAEQWGIDYLVNAKGFSILKAATVTSSMFVGWAIGAPLMGLLSEKIKRRRLPMLLGSFAASVLVSICLYMPNLKLDELRILFGLVGFASSTQILVFAVAHDLIKPQLIGTGVALTNMVINIGGLIQPIIGFMLIWFTPKAIQLSETTTHYPIESYQKALLILPICFIVALVISAFFLKESYRSSTKKNANDDTSKPIASH
jgi:MFS family permease